MRNAGLGEAQDEIKIDERNINNLRYADNATLMAESEEELKNLLIKLKEESENASLKLNFQEQILDSVGEGESRMIWEKSIETCILSYVK